MNTPDRECTFETFAESRPGHVYRCRFHGFMPHEIKDLQNLMAQTTHFPDLEASCNEAVFRFGPNKSI